MPKLEKLLQMLKSPKASTRYEACEELRLSLVSNEQIVLALEETQYDKDPLVAEAARSALAADVHRKMLRKLGRYISLTEEEIRSELANQVKRARPPILRAKLPVFLSITISF